MKDEVRKAQQVLKAGGLILYPTDTVWGIGCDATNEEAVQKVYALKKRADNKALITLVESDGMMSQYVEQVPDMAWEIVPYAEKPLTVIYPNARNLAKNLIAENGSIAIRVTKDEFCKRLIYNFARPIVSTSANISGEPTPGNFSEISQEILNGVDYVVNWRQEEKTKAQPSTIIRLELDGEIEFIRK